MAFKITAYTQASMPVLQPVWESLQVGSDMTYFQTWEWNNMLLRGVPKDSAYFEVLFLVVEQDAMPVMLAPLWIIKKKYRAVHNPSIYLLGHGGWSDYLNFIYDTFSAEAVETILSYLRSRFGLIPFVLSSLKESVSLYTYLTEYCDIQQDVTGKCVAIHLNEHEENWFESLSKHTRQNIRTAKNRMERDGIQYRCCYDDENVNAEHCIQIRANRFQWKLLRDEGRVTLTKRIKRYIKRIFCEIPSQGGYTPIKDDPSARVMTIYNGDELMAYFHYGYDSVHRQMVVISAGVVENYTKYSPGMVLMSDFIRTSMGGMVIDFTRGDEPYKLALGGQIHYNHTIRLKL